MTSKVYSSHQFPMSYAPSCKACLKHFNDTENMIPNNVEFNYNFYHIDCFKCKCCSKVLKFNCESEFLPYTDQFENLFCLNDYIESLKCKICSKNFNHNSNIQPVMSSLESDCNDNLVHMECFNCNLCHESIQVSNEYFYDSDRCLLFCKPCNEKTLKQGKSLKDTASRLSTHQKELIKRKFMIESPESVNNTNFITEFANEIQCNSECLVKYLGSHLITKEVATASANIDQTKQTCDANEATINLSNKNLETIESIIEQLSKIDKIIAPNKNPFLIK